MPDSNFVIYFCTSCNKNVADGRGLPVFDCSLCGASSEMLEDERKPDPLTNILYTCKLVCTDYGLDDIDIFDHPLGIRRVKIPHSIKVGETFNVYHGQSSKVGVKWVGNLEGSLAKVSSLKQPI